jgi:hypothetical protein
MTLRILLAHNEPFPIQQLPYPSGHPNPVSAYNISTYLTWNPTFGDNTPTLTVHMARKKRQNCLQSEDQREYPSN